MNNQDNISNTTQFSASVDLGPLSWVVDSLRDSVHNVRDQLLEFSQEVTNASGSHVTTLDTVNLRMAAQGLRDCGGVLDLVERPAAATMVSAMEKAVQSFIGQPELCTPEAVTVLNHAGNAVIDYVLSVSSGQADYSVGLFPLYKSVSTLSDTKRVHPADLWHYNWRWLELKEDIPLTQKDTLTGDNIFFESVLSIFQSQGKSGVEPLSVHTHRLWLDGSSLETRVFWQLATGFLQILAQQDILILDVYIKRLLSRMAVQYDLQRQGKLDVPEQLAQDILFFIALGYKNKPTINASVVQAIVRHYDLQQVPICNYADLLYGKIDPNIRTNLRREVAAFKELWTDISAGSVNKLEKLLQHTQSMVGHINTLWPEAQILSTALIDVVRTIVDSGKTPSADLAMEVATSILFLEVTLEDYQADNVEVGIRANTLAQRLQSVQQGNALDPLEDWMEDFYARLNDKDSIDQAVVEANMTMAEIEQALDDFFRHPQKIQQASESVDKLQKISSVLMVLDCLDASSAVTAMAGQVQQLVIASQSTGNIDDLESQNNVLRLGNSLGTLSFMLDMMGYQPDRARVQFRFDTESQELVYSDAPVKTAAADGVLSLEPELFSDDIVLPSQADSKTEKPIEEQKEALAFVGAATKMEDEGIYDAPLEDEELREIFLEEAQEVIGNARTAVDALYQDFTDETELTNLRRGFHTLKGSGRMVGLASFGEAAWEIERMLNAWLADNKPVSELLLALCTDGLNALDEWRGNIANHAANPWHHSSFKAPVATMLADGIYPKPIALPVAGEAADASVVQKDATHDLGNVFANNASNIISADEGLPVNDESALFSDMSAASLFTAETDCVGDTVASFEKDGYATVTEGAPAIFVDDTLDIMLEMPTTQTPEDIENIEEQTAQDSGIQETQYASTALPEDSILITENVASDAHVRLPQEQTQAVDIFSFSDGFDASNVIGVESKDDAAALFADEDDALLFTDEVDSDIFLEKEAEVDSAMATELNIDSGYDKTNETVLMGDSLMPEVELDIDAGFEQSNEAVLIGDSVIPKLEEENVTATSIADVVPTPTAALKGFLVDTQQQLIVLHDMVEGLPEDEIKQVNEHPVPLALFNAYLSEADAWSRQLVQELEEWALDDTKSAPESAANLAHSLAGSSAAVGLSGLASLSRAIEHTINHLSNRAVKSDEITIVLQAAQTVRQDLHQFAAGLAQPFELQLLYQLAAIVDNQALPTVNVSAVTPLQLAQFIQTSIGVAEKKTAKLAQGFTLNPEKSQEKIIQADISQLSGMDEKSADIDVEEASATPIGSTSDSTTSTESRAQPIAPSNQAVTQATPEVESKFVAEAVLQSVAVTPVHIETTDVIEPELFEIFSEEAEILLPDMSQALSQWQEQPSQMEARRSLMRLLHTFKGGARLAGAMQLGAMAHDMESSIGEFGTHEHTAEEIRQLQSALDDIDTYYRQLVAGGGANMPATELRSGSAPDGALAASSGIGTVISEGTSHARVAAPVATKFLEVQQVQQQQVRVRAQVLDRMLSQTGEVMTSRSRLETEVQGMRQAVTDMDGSLDRLRTQLRDMELQAESQMQSRMALASDNAANFDPLEFDRFTRVQELTRMMAEAVNDVASVQRNMARVVRSTEDNLSAQARQAKDLQGDLLSTRMVEFDSLSDRLYRVVRQAAKESDKRVRLDVSGGTIEMDRTIIERIASPFEHLLRNAVVHGVETEAERTQAGKEAGGSININLQQDGNDVVISVRDDGRGLDIQRLRNKAVNQGLLSVDSNMNDEEAAQLIFQSGLSTAEAVTSLAGRGVGMDVVRSEVNALGGRIEVQTQAGKGTEFTLVLPLTTAVTQVVELRVGSLHIGVPSTLIEKVLRADAKTIEQSYNSQTYTVSDEKLPFYWAGAMLQHSQRSEDMAAKRQVVVVLRSAAQRIVIHVDAVLGNHEVIVKNIGPQLMRMPGLSGITILPNGKVLFIYNPVALSFVYDEHIREFSADLADPSVLGAGVISKSAIVQAPEQPTVLVVDDSITVRRVTERLLKREGYRVMLAADGLAALRELANQKPDIVLSDIEMPKMDGFDLLRNIRDDEKMQDLPVIMITSRTADKHREHAAELGATDFLGKPYPEDTLLQLLQQYTQNIAIS